MFEDWTLYEKVGAGLAALAGFVTAFGKRIWDAFARDDQLEQLRSIREGIEELQEINERADRVQDDLGRVLDVAEQHNERLVDLERSSVAQREQIRGISRRLDLVENRKAGS